MLEEASTDPLLGLPLENNNIFDEGSTNPSTVYIDMRIPSLMKDQPTLLYSPSFMIIYAGGRDKQPFLGIPLL
jgi:hypothetical protein